MTLNSTNEKFQVFRLFLSPLKLIHSARSRVQTQVKAFNLTISSLPVELGFTDFIDMF